MKNEDNRESMLKDMPAPYRVALICVVAMGLFFRAHRLGDKILWIDEGISWKVAKFDSVEKIIEYNRYEEHTPLPQILDHYWVKMAGDSVKALHMESVLYSSLALLLFVIIVFGNLNWRVAFGATVAFSLSAAIPNYAQMLRHPALSSLITQVWLFALFRYMRRKDVLSVLLYFLSLSLCVYVHMYTLFTMCGLVIYLIAFRKEHKTPIGALLAATVIAAFSIIPKFITMRDMGIDKLAVHIPLHAAIAHLETIPIGGLVRNMIFFCIGDTLIIEQLPFLAVTIILVFYAHIALKALSNRELRHITALCATVLATALTLGFFGMVFKGIYYQAKYYSAIVSLFSILFGVGIEQVWKTNRRAAHAFMIFSAVISAVILQTYYWSSLDRPENMKTILQYVKANEKPGDFLSISPPYTFNFDYYWRGNIPVRDFSKDFDPVTTPHNNVFLITSAHRQITDDRMLRWHERLASRHKRVWMFWILGAVNTEDRDRVAERWLNSHYKVLLTKQYRQIPFSKDYSGKLVLYEIPADGLPSIRTQPAR